MPQKPMSRTVKASLASGLAVLLLAGVGGTFARWFDEESVSTDDIDAGSLTLSTPAAVTYTEATLGTITDITAFNMVPGDVVTIATTVTPTLVGDNLQATLSADIGTATGTLAEFVTVDVTVDGATDATLDETDSGTAVDVEIEVSLPLSTGGEPDDADAATDGTQAQGTTLNLEDLALSLVQLDNPVIP